MNSARLKAIFFTLCPFLEPIHPKAFLGLVLQVSGAAFVGWSFINPSFAISAIIFYFVSVKYGTGLARVYGGPLFSACVSFVSLGFMAANIVSKVQFNLLSLVCAFMFTLMALRQLGLARHLSRNRTP